MKSSFNEPLSFLFRKFWAYDVIIATFKNLLNKAFTEESLNKTDLEKVG